MFCKLHERNDFVVLACCDNELLGKELKDKKYEVKIRREFYNGEIVDEEKLSELLAQANNINLFGQNTVGVALKKGFIDKNDIIMINKVPHVQIFKV